MANKLITIGNQPPVLRTAKTAVFTDLARVATPNSKTSKDSCTFKLDKKTDILAVAESIRNIFTWIPGQRIINPEFGTNLYSYLYAGLNTLNTESVISEVRRAIMVYEPRVKVETLVNSTSPEEEANHTISLDIIYTVPGLSDTRYAYTYKQTNS